jgi:hypothetical protein
MLSPEIVREGVGSDMIKFFFPQCRQNCFYSLSAQGFYEIVIEARIGSGIPDSLTFSLRETIVGTAFAESFRLTDSVL